MPNDPLIVLDGLYPFFCKCFVAPVFVLFDPQLMTVEVSLWASATNSLLDKKCSLAELPGIARFAMGTVSVTPSTGKCIVVFVIDVVVNKRDKVYRTDLLYLIQKQ